MSASAITLDAVLSQCGARLTHAADDPGDAFRTFALATADDSGPAVRTVVLRQANFDARRVVIHTDHRSAKAQSIATQSAVSLLFYDPSTRVQLRADASARIERDGDTADALWERVPPVARQLFQTPKPGATIDTPADVLSDRDPAPNAGRDHFAAVVCTLNALDWLRLGEEHHSRAVFRWRTSHWDGHWVAP